MKATRCGVAGGSMRQLQHRTARYRADGLSRAGIAPTVTRPRRAPARARPSTSDKAGWPRSEERRGTYPGAVGPSVTTGRGPCWRPALRGHSPRVRMRPRRCPQARRAHLADRGVSLAAPSIRTRRQAGRPHARARAGSARTALCRGVHPLAGPPRLTAAEGPVPCPVFGFTRASSTRSRQSVCAAPVGDLAASPCDREPRFAIRPALGLHSADTSEPSAKTIEGEHPICIRVLGA